MSKCQINIAPPEEDCGRHMAFTQCGEPAHWRVEPDGFEVCETHCMEFLRNGSNEVQGIIDCDRVDLDKDGEIARAQ